MIPHRENGGEAAERSEANKVYISTFTCNTIKKTAAKPPTERSEANKVYIYLYK